MICIAIWGKGEEGDEQDIITNTHAHKAQSLFFYENMQGKGKSKKQSQNGVDIDYPDLMSKRRLRLERRETLW